MPSHYKRKYKKRRYGRKSAYAMAKKSLHISKFLARGVERKHVTYDLSISGVDFNGIISINMNSMPQGANDLSRIGDKVLDNSLYFGCEFYRGSADCNLRVLVFWDKQNLVANPNDLIDSVGTILAPVADIHVDKRKRWTKIMDRTYTLTSADKTLQVFRKRFKINKSTYFNQGTTTINTGRMAVLWITDLNAGLPIADYPQIISFSRVYYTDL